MANMYAKIFCLTIIGLAIIQANATPVRVEREAWYESKDPLGKLGGKAENAVNKIIKKGSRKVEDAMGRVDEFVDKASKKIFGTEKPPSTLDVIGDKLSKKAGKILTKLDRGLEDLADMKPPGFLSKIGLS